MVTMVKKSVLLVVASACLSLPVQAEELRFAGAIPSEHVIVKKSYLTYFDRVRDRTDGRVDFNYYSGGVLVPPKSVMSGLQGGVAHAGQMITTYYNKEVPHTHLINGSMVFLQDLLVGAGAAQEFYYLHCKECKKEYADRGLIRLADYPTSPYFNILCRPEVKTLDDLEGLRIRGVSESLRWIAALGATPVNMPGTEMIEAMRIGHVDCATGPISWIENYSLTETLRSVLLIPRGAWPAINFMVMRRPVWDGLSPEDKQVVIDELPEAIASAAIFGYDNFDDQVRQRAEEAGIEFFEVPEAALEGRYQRFLEDERARLKEQFTEWGVEDPEGMVNRFLEIVEKWDGLVEAMKTRSVEEYADLLREQVFDKIDPAKL